MFQLAGSLATPIMGALLYGWLHDQPDAIRLFDGFMYIAVPALLSFLHRNLKIFHHRIGKELFAGRPCHALGVFLRTFVDPHLHEFPDPDPFDPFETKVFKGMVGRFSLRIENRGPESDTDTGFIHGIARRYRNDTALGCTERYAMYFCHALPLSFSAGTPLKSEYTARKILISK